MIRSPESLTRTQRRRNEQERLDRSFWPEAITILQEHNTDILQQRVLQVAQVSPNVSIPRTEKVVTTIVDAYRGETRKHTNEAEVNHAFQVGLLIAQAVGWRDLTTETLTLALAHDLDENTAQTAAEIAAVTSPKVYAGIDALSHKSNGKDSYPGAVTKRPYFSDIIKADRKDPTLHVAGVKVIDQICVSNGPVTEAELKDPSLKQNWNDLTAKKIGEMELFYTMLPDKGLYAKRLLREAIAFVKLRQNPDEGTKLLRQALLRKDQEQVLFRA